MTPSFSSDAGDERKLNSDDLNPLTPTVAIKLCKTGLNRHL